MHLVSLGAQCVRIPKAAGRRRFPGRGDHPHGELVQVRAGGRRPARRVRGLPPRTPLGGRRRGFRPYAEPRRPVARHQGGAVKISGACPHITNLESVVRPKKLECEECVKIGSNWVHLRTCQTCGGTRCCDSSPNQPRVQARAELGPSRGLFRRARRELALLLPGRRHRRALIEGGHDGTLVPRLTRMTDPAARNATSGGRPSVRTNASP